MFGWFNDWIARTAARRKELERLAQEESVGLLQDIMKNQRRSYDLRRQLLATATLRQVAEE